MTSWAYQVPPHNSHYEGEYSSRELMWRAICASDKARNLARALVGVDVIGSVLEVGCGTGAVLQAVRDMGIGSQHVGIDVADPGAHIDPGARKSGLDLRTYDGSNLPLESASIELVYASHVLEHVIDERKFLSELKRVAKRYVYVEVPCEITVRTSVASLQRTLNIGHINSFTPETFALTLATSGLSVCKLVIEDHSFSVHRFHNSLASAVAKAVIRGAALATSQRLAPKIFSYHVGALCEVG